MLTSCLEPPTFNNFSKFPMLAKFFVELFLHFIELCYAPLSVGPRVSLAPLNASFLLYPTPPLFSINFEVGSNLEKPYNFGKSTRLRIV